MSRQTHRLGELQLAILQVLWQRQEATVAEVHGALSDRGLAPTTIATMLRKMERRQLVDHTTVGRQFVYRALLRQEDVSRSMVGDLVQRLFEGDPLALVDHLLRAGEVDLQELQELRRRVDEDDDASEVDRG